MNESRRKLLTEYIGECWHEPITLETCSCNRERIVNAVAHAHNMNRPFTTPDDMNAVMQAIVKVGKWGEF